jgi:UDP-N-acetylmuramoyl-tripeptide--D-alanyl-D-alanine ligase
MIEGRIADYISALGAEVRFDSSEREKHFRGAAIDSRTIEPDNIFFCVAGETHDGHDFIAQAVEKGAAAIVAGHRASVDTAGLGNAALITVPDPLHAMGELARHYLLGIKSRKIAVTGTNGKTTCKNMIAHLLTSTHRCCSTRGNFNNLYGVPLSIFSFDRECEVSVFEFGMSTPGEIARLVEIVDPDVRVILNIGPAHLETLKTIDAIADAKFEILTRLKADDWAVANFDDILISKRIQTYQVRKLTFGTGEECEIRPQKVYLNGSGHTHFLYEGADIRIPLLGKHHLSNCLATTAVARIMEIPPQQIKNSLESFTPTGYRMQSQVIAGVTIINDAYNANPTSMKAVIETISAMPVQGSRIAVLGDMLELGGDAERYHAELGEMLARSKCDYALLTGEFASLVRERALAGGMPESSLRIMLDRSEMASHLSLVVRTGDLVLFKASRALELEIVAEKLVSLLGRAN